ncbi:4'-phosphopantetheinyl transferase family protein [Pedococcus sp. P5_B7]
MSPRRWKATAPPAVLFAWAPSANVLAHVSGSLDARNLLSPAEAARCARLSAVVDRDDFLAARVLTRLLLRHRLAPGSPLEWISRPTVSQTCDVCGGPHGRPSVDVPGAEISWSHSHGYVAAAVGPDAIGVDIEPLRPDVASVSSLPAWVRAEAIVKWGHGNLDESSAWRPVLDGPPAVHGRRHRLDTGGRPRARRALLGSRVDVVITDTPPNDAFVCSVAATSPARWVDPLG